VFSYGVLTRLVLGEAKLLLERDRATVCIDTKHYTTVNKMRSRFHNP
jgi:hypothetical protein